jgi:hypothetical protein
MSKFGAHKVRAAITATMLGGAIALMPITAASASPVSVSYSADTTAPTPAERGAVIATDPLAGQDLSGVIIALALMCAGAGVLAWRRSATTM